MVHYQELAVDWSPVSRSNRRFNLLAIVMLVSVLMLAFYMSSIHVPVKERTTQIVVPERIANFIVQKKKKQPEIIKPRPEIKPKPVIKAPEPEKPGKVVRKKTKKKMLTREQKEIREKLAGTGLLALSNELSGLMETKEVAAMVSGNVNVNTNTNRHKQSDKARAVLLQDVSKGSGGVNSSSYAAKVERQLAVQSDVDIRVAEREISRVESSLITSEPVKSNVKRSSKPGSAVGFRAEEDITLVFDRNKSQLYSLYDRARRKNAGLKGKLVLEITITPDGKVSLVRLLASELEDDSLVSRLISRVKQFDFGAKNVETVVVTYPVEFLPG